MTDKYLEISNVEDLKAGDILCFLNLRVPGEWMRFVILEVTKRLLKTYVLFDCTRVQTPGDIYSFQIIDLEPSNWRLLA